MTSTTTPLPEHVIVARTAHGALSAARQAVLDVASRAGLSSRWWDVADDLATLQGRVYLVCGWADPHDYDHRYADEVPTTDPIRVRARARSIDAALDDMVVALGRRRELLSEATKTVSVLLCTVDGLVDGRSHG